MVDVVKASFDIAFDKPFGACPCLSHGVKRRVTSTSRSKPMGGVAHLRFVIGFQNEAYHFLQELVRPSVYAESPHSPVFLRNAYPAYWFPSVAFMAEIVNDAPDFCE